MVVEVFSGPPFIVLPLAKRGTEEAGHFRAFHVPEEWPFGFLLACCTFGQRSLLIDPGADDRCPATGLTGKNSTDLVLDD